MARDWSELHARQGTAHDAYRQSQPKAAFLDNPLPTCASTVRPPSLDRGESWHEAITGAYIGPCPPTGPLRVEEKEGLRVMVMSSGMYHRSPGGDTCDPDLMLPALRHPLGEGPKCL